ncbi:MAG: hypothetical protein NC419_01065 [Muribaculaceae bacterium]|nr:hypothetical protein [Muribaculaceae bacterium]
MLFNSYIFVFLFFPICLIGYYALVHWKQKQGAQLFLIAMSFWFYGYFRVEYLLIMVVSIAGNYLFHKLLSRKLSKAAAKWLLFGAVAANLSVLFYFKYYDFFITSLNAATGSSYALRHVLLPLGISFFTFQQIGFLADTYRGEIRNCGLIPYALFVSFFPQLIAGPIVSQAEMLGQFETMTEKKFQWERFARGWILFVLGLFKKVILADTLGAGVDYGYLHIGLLGRADALIVILSYTLQLYFDFSGYCDMARGVGSMLGMEIPINFNSPYQAVNIVDFWKRWHMTLNRFFTRYVYIPLGGNRKGKGRMYVNLLLVFLLSGLWHGAGWNFLLWGMLHGVLYVMTRWWQGRFSIKVTLVSTWVSRICLFLYVSVAWVYFRAENIVQANRLLLVALRGNVQKVSLSLAECFRLDEFWYVIKALHLDKAPYSGYFLMIFMLVVSVLLAMCGRNAAGIAEHVKGRAFSAVLFGVVFVWCILSFSQVSTFLYFNF